MRIIVDTNIVFSGILNHRSKIGELLIKSKKHFDFYTVNQMKIEIFEHKEKIKKLGHFSEDEFKEAFRLATSKIKIIDETLIPMKDLEKAESLLFDIDVDDTIFLAIALNLDAKLWTGDKKVSSGLQKKKVLQTISTSELYEIFLQLEMR